jgi:hypothetical protein
MTFFFFRSAEIWKFSVWAAAMALYSSYLMTFIFFRAAIFFFWGPLEKKMIKNSNLQLFKFIYSINDT